MIRDASTAIVLGSSSIYLVVGSDGHEIRLTFVFCFLAAVVGAVLRGWKDTREISQKAPEVLISISVGSAAGLFLSKSPYIINYVGDNPISIGVLLSLLISLSIKELKQILAWGVDFVKDFLTQKFLKK